MWACNLIMCEPRLNKMSQILKIIKLNIFLPSLTPYNGNILANISI